MGSRREALFAAFKAKVEESGLGIDWDWNHYHKYAVDFFGNRYATLEKTYLRIQAGEASGKCSRFGPYVYRSQLS